MLHSLAVLGLRAGPGVERTARLREVEGRDERADVARLDLRARERVVGPVRDEQAADAEPPVERDPAVDVFAVALRLAHVLAAAEQVGRLDAKEDGELPALDRAPRLARVPDEPEPALARPAGLSVDVVLELANPLRLELDRLGLVA